MRLLTIEPGLMRSTRRIRRGWTRAFHRSCLVCSSTCFVRIVSTTPVVSVRRAFAFRMDVSSLVSPLCDLLVDPSLSCFRRMRWSQLPSLREWRTWCGSAAFHVVVFEGWDRNQREMGVDGWSVGREGMVIRSLVDGSNQRNGGEQEKPGVWAFRRLPTSVLLPRSCWVPIRRERPWWGHHASSFLLPTPSKGHPRPSDPTVRPPKGKKHVDVGAPTHLHDQTIPHARAKERMPGIQTKEPTPARMGSKPKTNHVLVPTTPTRRTRLSRLSGRRVPPKRQIRRSTRLVGTHPTRRE